MPARRKNSCARVKTSLLPRQPDFLKVGLDGQPIGLEFVVNLVDLSAVDVEHYGGHQQVENGFHTSIKRLRSAPFNSTDTLERGIIYMTTSVSPFVQLFRDLLRFQVDTWRDLLHNQDIPKEV